MKRLLLSALLLVNLASIDRSDAATPQFTKFTYQGRLSANGQPASGNFDLQFKLFDAAADGAGTQVGSTITMNAFAIVNGTFTTDLDFPGAFTGNQLWLEVTVGTQTLSPREPVNSVPVAQYALATPPPPVPPVFMSSTANAAPTVDSFGSPQQAVLPLSGHTSSAYMATTAFPGGPVDLTPTGSSQPPAPQLFASNGTIGSMRGIAFVQQPLSLGPSFVAIYAQVYTAAAGSGAVLSPLPGASCEFLPVLGGPVAAGTQLTCLQTGINVAYSAGD